MRTADVARLLEDSTLAPLQPAMTGEQFSREKNYRVAIAVARSMRAQGLITPEEMKRIERFFARKFSPVWGDL